MSRNRLGDETSPYLLQHKDNPVHWWAWGPEALQEAKDTGKPILLSVGYAACHWCHVMAHESFENEDIAAIMNEHFINIKVDREERPDIDAIYMGALHQLGEQGGWPLTMFLDTEAKPFWGGTYFPDKPKFGRPGFPDILRGVSKAFHAEPEKIAHNGKALLDALSKEAPTSGVLEIGDTLLKDLTSRIVRAIDPTHGGIAGAPKFPQWSFFWLMWRGAIRYDNAQAKQAVENTLTHICQGGIYDHLGGGFARYSVDERWLAPHFEKMLYDNALLVDLLSEVYRETKNPLYEVRVAETIAWLEREMIAEGGAFAASLDADSEGEEGKFYVWSVDEITDVLGADDAKFFCEIYDAEPGGNWEGKVILNRLERLEPLGQEAEARCADLRQKLLAARDKRIRPAWDDKVLADWNGLMIAGLVHAARTFNKPEWISRAKKAFSFVESELVNDGRMHHSIRAGRIGARATASDYANMIWAALRLHQATNDPEYLQTAKTWADTLHQHHWLPDKNRYATTAEDASDVIVRLANGADDATPNANAIMVSNLMTLSLLTGDARTIDQTGALLQSFAADMAQNLIAHTGLLAGAFDVLTPQHIVIAKQDEVHADLEDTLTSVSLPGSTQTTFVENEASKTLPWADGKWPVDGQAAAYVCVGPRCSAPITDKEVLSNTLKAQRCTPIK